MSKIARLMMISGASLVMAIETTVSPETRHGMFLGATIFLCFWFLSGCLEAYRCWRLAGHGDPS